MSGANHRTGCVSTFPFPIMGLVGGTPRSRHRHTVGGDTVIGNDVWISGNATIMPGVRIGHGAIVSTESVVTNNVPDYTIVGGSPATHIRDRFTEDEVRSLVRLAWWDWPIEVITENIRTIAAGLVKDLEQISQRLPR